MDLTLNSDQTGLLDAVSKLVTPYRAVPPNTQETLLSNPALATALDAGGFRDIARFDGMTPLDAALIGEIVHGLPYSVEYIGSALLGAALDIEIAGPLSILQSPATAPARFLAPGGTALIVDGDDVVVLELTEALATAVETPFAYPLGRLTTSAQAEGRRIPGASGTALQWWAVALAVELGATVKGAVDLTVDYLKDRRQFGKPIGSYQAVQHRISECVVAAHAIQTLARRAAAMGTMEAALVALVHAKEACSRIIYDTHQFQGAIGLTYEYPLHFYTYRLRLLHGELASLADCAEQLALLRWDHGVVEWSE